MKKLCLLAVPLLLTLSGCVTGTRTLESLATPDHPNTAAASGNVFIGNIRDGRSFEHKPRSPSTPSVKGELNEVSRDERAVLVGRQRNGYGAAMGDVALPAGESVPDKVRELLVEGLESRGYVVVEDASAPYNISADVEKFWAWFSPGFTSVSFEAEVQCEVVVERPTGPVTLQFAGRGLNKGQIASNANWELAYQRAFEEFLNNMDTVLDDAGL